MAAHFRHRRRELAELDPFVLSVLGCSAEPLTVIGVHHLLDALAPAERDRLPKCYRHASRDRQSCMIRYCFDRLEKRKLAAFVMVTTALGATARAWYAAPV